MKRVSLILVLAGAVVFAASPTSALAASRGWKAHKVVSSPLLSVAAVDAAHAWAVGPEPSIVATTDGGAHWIAQDPGTTNELFGVAFSDFLDGWAVGDAGTVVATTDGGADWTPQAVPVSSVPLIGVSSRGPDCWAVGAGGAIVATTDGGATWAAQSSSTVRDLFSVSFADTAHGWAVGDHGRIVATTNGGADWTRQTSPNDDYLNGVTSRGALRAWAVGEGGLIIATTDGGTHWVVRRPSSGQAPDLYTVAFADACHGWAVGVGGLILATTDRGVTWRPQTCPAKKQDLASVAFADRLHGFVAGTGGTMLTTASGGWADAKPPKTVAEGAAGWHSRDVRVVFHASDGRGGSGVAAVEYSLDHGATWKHGSAFTVPARADHSADGYHPFLYRSTDNAGNVEATRKGSVRIDTRRPVPHAPWAATAVTGRPAALRCYAADARPGSATVTLTIRIRTASGRTVKVMRFARRSVNKPLTCDYLCTLPPGRYRFLVSATDAAGNRGGPAASNHLVVRRAVVQAARDILG